MTESRATTSVELLETGTVVDVRTRPTPELRELLETIETARRKGASWTELDEQLIDAILELIVSHEWEGPLSYESRAIWVGIRDDSGPQRLAEALIELLEPMRNRAEYTGPGRDLRTRPTR